VHEICINRSLSLLCAVVLLSACGGGGNDPPLPGSLQFSASSISVDENGGTATLTITRTGGTAGAVSATVASSDGSATAGHDYSATSTSVTFAAGDATVQSVTIPIADDGAAEADETLSVTLSEPTGGASLGANGAATLTILDDDPPAAPVLSSVVAPSMKVLGFEWPSVPGATHYRLLQDPDGRSGFSQVGADHAAGVDEAVLDIAVHRLDWANALYRLEACNGPRCSASAAVSVRDVMLQAIGYFKASNPQAGDVFGRAIALSADGRTLAVVAPGEDSGVRDDPSDNSAPSSGAVYVFAHEGAQWRQQAYLKASNAAANDTFGVALALSADGHTLAVGADGEDSAATGVGGDEANNGAELSGAVYVFARQGTQWSQQAYVKASNTQAGDLFGSALALSADGHTLAVGATFEDSAATGVGGNQNDNGALESGAVYVFTRAGAQWSQQGYVKASNTQAADFFGSALALSADGNTLAVGAPNESSSATGVGGDETDNGAAVSGAVYVFARQGTQWSQQAYVKASNTQIGDVFGSALALSADGHTLAVGAVGEDSAATGVGGDEADNGSTGSGAAYLFTRDAAQWSQQAYVKASNTSAQDAFARGLALSADGHTLAVGATGENSAATGVGGDENNSLAASAGAVYTFTRTSTAWLPQGYVKASNTDAGDLFGGAVGLSADGSILAVGALGERSNAAGVSADQANNDAINAGAVYLY
jgi:trimeric autotransporter adhesin